MYCIKAYLRKILKYAYLSTPHNVQPYTYEFVKDNKTYTLSVVRDDLVKIDDMYYNINNYI